MTNKKIYSREEILKKTESFLKENSNGIVEIIGATTSGKTGFSINLAHFIMEKFSKKSEIISVDSRQIFREINISSAKITTQEMCGIPHYGLDLINPNERFSVADFQKYSFEKITEIQNRNNIAILCGGTMLWCDAITENYEFAPINEKKSTKKLPPKWPVFKIGIYWSREKLYERINLRAEIHFNSGLIEESEQLLQKWKLSPSAKTSFGLVEIEKYKAGEINLEEAQELNRKRNRHYAKRQLTWWRGRDDIFWVDGEKL
jgi:tRNA dimethylallyltransferase